MNGEVLEKRELHKQNFSESINEKLGFDPDKLYSLDEIHQRLGECGLNCGLVKYEPTQARIGKEIIEKLVEIEMIVYDAFENSFGCQD